MKLHHSNPHAVQRRKRAAEPSVKDMLVDLIDAVADAGVNLPPHLIDWAAQQIKNKEEKK